MSETIVSYPVEVSRDQGKTWMTWAFVPQSDMVTQDENEMTAKERWRRQLPGDTHRGSLVFRLVKRTAVITDEVLAEEPHKDVVIFRKWRSGLLPGVIALFPEIDAGNGYVSSYESLGHHGGASYEGVMSRTVPATGEEYSALKKELESAPYYYLLDVRKRRPA